MFELYGGVILAHDIPQCDLKAGDVGTIVERYGDDTVFLVEFIAANGEGIAVLDLRRDEVSPVGTQVVESRPLADTTLPHVKQVRAPNMV